MSRRVEYFDREQARTDRTTIAMVNAHRKLEFQNEGQRTNALVLAVNLIVSGCRDSDEKFWTDFFDSTTDTVHLRFDE